MNKFDSFVKIRLPQGILAMPLSQRARSLYPGGYTRYDQGDDGCGRLPKKWKRFVWLHCRGNYRPDPLRRWGPWLHS